MTTHLTFTPNDPGNSLAKKIRLYGTLALVATAAVALSVTAAASRTDFPVVGITVIPPTVPGIEPAPSAARYYRPVAPRTFPSAKIFHLEEEVGPNGCGPNKFEVLNARAGEQRCVGY